MCACICYGFVGFKLLKNCFILYCIFYSTSYFYLGIFILLHRELDPALLYSPCSVHVEFLLRITDTTVQAVLVPFLPLWQHARTNQLTGWRMCDGSWFQRVSGHHSRADMTERHRVVAGAYDTGFSTWHRQEGDSNGMESGGGITFKGLSPVTHFRHPHLVPWRLHTEPEPVDYILDSNLRLCHS